MNDDYILLQEDTSKGYEPTSEEILEEAKYLGIESDDTDYLWIAKEALRAPLPRHWKPYQHTKSGNIVYYNETTGEVIEDHPLDQYFRSFYQKMISDPKSNKQSFSIPSNMHHNSDLWSKGKTKTINPQMYLSSLRSYNTYRIDVVLIISDESAKLCKDTHQIAVEVNLYNEWMKDSIKSMEDSIRRIEYLEKRMKGAISSSCTVPSV